MTKISSGLRTLFLVHFVVGLVVGLLYLLVPGMFMGWFGMPVPDELPYRIVGAAVLAFTASSWYCYHLSFPLDPVFHIFTRKYVIFGTLTGLGKWGFDYNWEHGIYPKS